MSVILTGLAVVVFTVVEAKREISLVGETIKKTVAEAAEERHVLHELHVDIVLPGGGTTKVIGYRYANQDVNEFVEEVNEMIRAAKKGVER